MSSIVVFLLSFKKETGKLPQFVQGVLDLEHPSTSSYLGISFACGSYSYITIQSESFSQANSCIAEDKSESTYEFDPNIPHTHTKSKLFKSTRVPIQSSLDMIQTQLPTTNHRMENVVVSACENLKLARCYQLNPF